MQVSKFHSQPPEFVSLSTTWGLTLVLQSNLHRTPGKWLLWAQHAKRSGSWGGHGQTGFSLCCRLPMGGHMSATGTHGGGHTHTQSHTCAHMNRGTCAHSCASACRCTHVCMLTQRHMHVDAHTWAKAHTCTCACIHTQPHMQACTQCHSAHAAKHTVGA